MSETRLEADSVRQQRDSWYTVWVAYEKASTTWNVISTIWKRAPALLQISVLLGLALFLSGAGVFMVGWMHQDQGDALWALLVMGASEILLLYILDKMKAALAQEFGSKEVAQPPERGRHINTRYLMFRKGLIEGAVGPAEVSGLFDLMDMQIDMASTDLPSKKVMAFSYGIIAAILAIIWKAQSPAVLVQIMVAILMIGWLIASVISLFPSRLERAKEMKYFMLLFSRKADAAGAGAADQVDV